MRMNALGASDVAADEAAVWASAMGSRSGGEQHAAARESRHAQERTTIDEDALHDASLPLNAVRAGSLEPRR